MGGNQGAATGQQQRGNRTDAADAGGDERGDVQSAHE
jgi:hypothetical protein